MPMQKCTNRRSTLSLHMSRNGCSALSDSRSNSDCSSALKPFLRPALFKLRLQYLCFIIRNGSQQSPLKRLRACIKHVASGEIDLILDILLRREADVLKISLILPANDSTLHCIMSSDTKGQWCLLYLALRNAPLSYITLTWSKVVLIWQIDCKRCFSLKVVVFQPKYKIVHV